MMPEPPWHAIRFRGEPEMRCEQCHSWWPLTDDFWYPRRGWHRCRACSRENRKVRARLRRYRYYWCHVEQERARAKARRAMKKAAAA